MKFETNILIKCDCPDCGADVPIVIEQSPRRVWMQDTFIHATYAHHKHPGSTSTCETTDMPIRGICSVCQMAVAVFGTDVQDHMTGISNEKCPGSGESIYDFTAELALMEMMK